DERGLHGLRQQLRAGHRRGDRGIRHRVQGGLRNGDRPAGGGAGIDCSGPRRSVLPAPLLRGRRTDGRRGDADALIPMPPQGEQTEIIVIGGGQAGLAMGYWLQRRQRSFVILDREPHPGGAWRRAWDGLTLFSPGTWSSLPGWLFPGGTNAYPSRDELLDYLEQYETRYRLPVERTVTVAGVHREGDGFRVET